MRIYESQSLKKVRVRVITERTTGKYCGYILQVFNETVTTVIQEDGEISLLIAAIGLDKANDQRKEGKAAGHGYNKDAFSIADFIRKNCNVNEDELKQLEAGRIDKFFNDRGLEIYSVV